MTRQRHRIYTVSFASVYPHYVAKAEKKGRTKAEVDEIVRWLTGYSQHELEVQLEQQVDIETFLAQAPETEPFAGVDHRCDLWTPRSDRQGFTTADHEESEIGAIVILVWAVRGGRGRCR